MVVSEQPPRCTDTAHLWQDCPPTTATEMSSHSLSGEIWNLFVATVASIDQKSPCCDHIMNIGGPVQVFPSESYWNVLTVGKTDCAVVVYKSKPLTFSPSTHWPHWARLWNVFKSSFTCSLWLPLICLRETLRICYLYFVVLHEISYSGASRAVVWPLTCAILMTYGCIWMFVAWNPKHIMSGALHTDPFSNPPTVHNVVTTWPVQHFPKENIQLLRYLPFYYGEICCLIFPLLEMKYFKIWFGWSTTQMNVIPLLGSFPVIPYRCVTSNICLRLWFRPLDRFYYQWQGERSRWILYSFFPKNQQLSTSYRATGAVLEPF